MLHRMVSRPAGFLGYAALALAVASCEDNTTGTPITPPPPSTAVYVEAVTPEGGYFVDTTTITVQRPDTTISAPDTTIVGIDTTITIDTTIVLVDKDTVVSIVAPDPVFFVVLPNGDTAVGQTVNFSLTLPGLLEQTSDVVDADGHVTTGRWILTKVCPNPLPEPPDDPVYCLPSQSVVATPASGEPGVITVDAKYPTEVPEELRAAHARARARSH